MKHRFDITVLLFLLFLTAHFIGLLVVNHYNIKKDLPYNIEPPEVKEKTSFITIFLVLLISTGIAMILIKFRSMRFLKFAIFFSILIALAVTFSSFLNSRVAFFIALALALWRIFKPNVFVHNFTEIFIYGGVAALFIPILNLFSVIFLLILISVYDFIAVYKTKHMIKMAKFQIKSKAFTGLSLPYERKKEKVSAILGGGDIAFTLFFSGVILRDFGLLQAFISSIIIGISLLALLLLGKKNKFYPAMPILTAGCFLSLLIVYLVF